MVAASEGKTLNSPLPWANSNTHRCREQLFLRDNRGLDEQL